MLTVYGAEFFVCPILSAFVKFLLLYVMSFAFPCLIINFGFLKFLSWICPDIEFLCLSCYLFTWREYVLSCLGLCPGYRSCPPGPYCLPWRGGRYCGWKGWRMRRRRRGVGGWSRTGWVAYLYSSLKQAECQLVMNQNPTCLRRKTN